jgi:hypothetical protein
LGPDFGEFIMGQSFKNPHPFDMSTYYSGQICVLGGRDYEHDDKKAAQQSNEKIQEKNISYELDWSFLKSNSKKTKARRS